jgi:hypothetical protein
LWHLRRLRRFYKLQFHHAAGRRCAIRLGNPLVAIAEGEARLALCRRPHRLAEPLRAVRLVATLLLRRYDVSTFSYRNTRGRNPASAGTLRRPAHGPHCPRGAWVGASPRPLGRALVGRQRSRAASTLRCRLYCRRVGPFVVQAPLHPRHVRLDRFVVPAEFAYILRDPLHGERFAVGILIAGDVVVGEAGGVRLVG